MRNKLTLTILSAFIFLALALPANAQTGCCCDPVLNNGSFETQTACLAKGFSYAGVPPSITTTCDQHCQTTITPTPVTTICGDNICQATETPTNCPADCGVALPRCNDPGYKPAPANFNATPIQGQKATRLTFTPECQVNYLTVLRCEGQCSDFQPVAQIPAQTTYIDEDPALKFNQEYTYAITANYVISGESAPAISTVNLGDIECWQNTVNSPFCSSTAYYERYKTYLQTHGYAQYTAQEFLLDFSRKTALTFATRLNSAWQCTDKNRLVPTTPQVQCSARQNEICVADERGPRCIVQENCGINFDPFGLFATQNTCEQGLLPKYCFYDKSQTVVNMCYSCSPRMSCYDYKTEETCQRDNCGAGQCQWHNTIPDLGIGVCVDRNKANCEYCNSTGAPDLQNKFTSLWDQCTEQKSNALSTLSNICFYDKDFKISKSCDEVSCQDYTRDQCNSPANGITLNSDNSLQSASNDVCHLRVCEFHDTTGCVKNADGNTGPGFQDCLPGNTACERDYFPPITTLIPEGTAGKVEKLTIKIFDKKNKTSSPQDYAGRTNYKTYLCVQTPTQTCTQATQYPTQVETNELLLKNGELKNGRTVLTTINPGQTSIYYYSRDPANNIETVKNISVVVCDACNGPILLNITVTGGRTVGNRIYTSYQNPTFTLYFDEPTTITYAGLIQSGQTIPLTHITPGITDTHQFTPSQLLTGQYNFTINGHNNRTIYVEPELSYALFVDPNVAQLTIQPPDGTIFNTTRLDITLNFSTPAELRNVVLRRDKAHPYAKQYEDKTITSQFTTTNNQAYTTTLTELTGGLHTLQITAKGFNELDIYRESTFFIATQPPTIRLVHPSFGVTPYSNFNITLETPLTSTCAYVYDTPTAPNSTDFRYFTALSGNNTMHTASGLSIPFGSKPKPLHVYCDFENLGISQRTFNISLDLEPPRIQKAFAEPATIAEQYIPGQEIYSTTLNVQLDKPGFCKYSLTTSTYEDMNGTFPGEGTTPKKAHTVPINVTQKQTYQYSVTCKGENELLSAPTVIPFTVNLNQSLIVTSSTPQGFSTLNFSIGVAANKRVICHFGQEASTINACMGSCSADYTHRQPLQVNSPGKYDYYITCTHPTGEQSDVIHIPIYVDTSPPDMEYVRDDSVLDDPNITWSQTKIRIAFKGSDPESNISHYLISLISQTERQPIFTNLLSNETSGEPIYITRKHDGTPFRLVNEQRYQFNVKSVNKVGLQSQQMESDGVKLDITQAPQACFDGDLNNNETDIDCGGPCEGCIENKQCLINTDCASNFCNNGMCQLASCQDSITNGLESDADCGGSPCPLCTNDKICITHQNCQSNYCDLFQGICTDAPACANNQFSPGETDIDCGGPCDPCNEGQQCKKHSDCSDRLLCNPDEMICTSEPVGDLDQDGIQDEQDTCLDTPLGEDIDETGCSASQRYTLGDQINDKWRLDYFGCIECEEAALNSDHDRDGLTNQEEYNLKTNPTRKDTDGDGWTDGNEVKQGTDPLNAEDHPTSIIGTAIKYLFILLVIVGLAYLGYGIYQHLPKPKPTKKEKKELEVPLSPTKQAELEKLRRFAKKEEIPDKDWIDLEEKIKKKSLSQKTFENALDKLKEVAHKKSDEKNPIQRLKHIVDDLGQKEKQKLQHNIELLKKGKLDTEERDELFEKLQLTKEYYEKHKKELTKKVEKHAKK